MYRALYAHKSQLPKYLSFEAGDRFTLIDTSVSDQWFLAQNGFGGIGFVPFNYIKKIEATTEQQVKFIDGAMEAIHLQATNAGGQYSHEQRLIMKKLVKHRSDVIKQASQAESGHGKSTGRRRPAPAPPVDRSVSVDAPCTGSSGSSLGSIGRSVTVTSATCASGDIKKSHKKKSSSSKEAAKQKSNSLPKTGVHQLPKPDVVPEEDMRKSVSISEGGGYPPSLMSSMSSNTSELTTTDSTADGSNSNPFETDDTASLNPFETDELPSEDEPPYPVNHHHHHQGQNDQNNSDHVGKHENYSEQQTEITHELQPDNSATTEERISPQLEENFVDHLPPPVNVDNFEESFESSASSMSKANECDIDSVDDLPPPPPEVYENSNEDDNYYNDETAPPPAMEEEEEEEEEEVKDMTESVGLFNSSNSEELAMYQKQALEECSCDDFKPKFDPNGPFFAKHSLRLPSSKNVKVTAKSRCDSDVLFSLLKSDNPERDQSEPSKSVEQFEIAQAYNVDVTHADCEEMIGEFRKLTSLSHEESHWALMAAMNLLAAKVPHIQPSLEAVALRFSMAHECHSTGRDYRCEDTMAIEQLLSELTVVTNDSQQRGHYLEDDLDAIIDIITGLSDTLSNAKHCVSVAAIQKDNYQMVETIARYYQMETRWVIHSCMLQLVEIICRLNPQAILEFLYTELPQELVAEMQQHHNDDCRFLQVCKTLGVIFMRGKPSPHKLSLTMDLHFFLWLLGMIENLAEMNRHGDVEMVVALVCSYHLQHQGSSQNPITEALKMAQGHALLETALMFLSKHDDPTQLLQSGIRPKVNSVILLLSHLYDNPDTADLLYTNDVEALIGIFEEFLRDLSREDPVRDQILTLLENFMRNYPDTVSFKRALSSRLGPLLLNIKTENKGAQSSIAAAILEDNSIVFDDV